MVFAILDLRCGGTMRELKCRSIIFAGLILAIFQSATPLFAQDKGERTIDEYLCKDVLREAGSNRDVAIAFLHGFLLGRSGNAKFNVQSLREQTDKFLDTCLDHPGDRAIDVMSKVKG